MSLSAVKLKHMQALSNKDGVIAAAAMDQRGSLQKSLAAAKGVPQKEIPDAMMEEFKVAVSKVLTPHASAILLDPQWGLPAAKARSANAGLLLATPICRMNIRGVIVTPAASAAVRRCANRLCASAGFPLFGRMRRRQ